MNQFCHLVLFSVFLGVRGDKIPFITPCCSGDRSCLMTAAAKALPILAAGVPEYNISCMDPMFVPRIKDNSGGLYFDLTNTTITGLKDCNITDIGLAGLKFNLDLNCWLRLKGNYSLAGNLIILDIEGKGSYKIRIRDLVVKFEGEFAETMVEGEKHWTLSHWNCTTDVLTNVQYRFPGLYDVDNGYNPRTYAMISGFFNQFWKRVYEDVSPPIVDEIVGKVLNEVMKLFEFFPVNQLILD